MKGSKGFTLLEVIIVLIIMAVLAGMAIQYIYRETQVAREEATRKKLEALKKAMIGDPAKVQGGVRNDFGYLGDWGGLPSALPHLSDAQSPAWSFNKDLKIGAGWRGPYISELFKAYREEYRVDEWGNELVYSDVDYTNEKGERVDGRIISPGPNKVEGGGDDITVEILKRETTADVFGYVRDAAGNYLPNAMVTIFFPQNGTLMQESKTTDSKGYYEFKNIPFGIRSIKVEPRLVYVVGSATTRNMGKDVEFKVANFSESNITINSLKAEYLSTPTAWYRKFKIGKETYWIVTKKDPGAGSGDTISFPAYTFRGTGAKREPYTIYVEKSSMQIPDIEVKGTGSEFVATLALKHFVDQKYHPAKPLDMTGVNFTVTFSDGSVIKFTPVKERDEEEWEKEWRDDNL